MNKEIVEQIKKFLSENEMFSGQPASEAQISDAEKKLGVEFDKEYKEFISLFGGSYVGVPIYGFNNCEMLSDETVVELTMGFREAYKEDDRWPVLEHSYVVSMTGSGDPVIINDKGNIVVYLHDNNEEEILANSLQELIEQNLPD